MGVLAERLVGSKGAWLMDGRRARVIEADVCGRLNVSEDDARLGRLEVSIEAIAGGRRTVEVVEIRRRGRKPPVATYGLKPSHGSEPGSAEMASRA